MGVIKETELPYFTAVLQRRETMTVAPQLILTVHLDQIKEEPSQKVALNPDKWIEFKLQDKAKVSQNTQIFRFLFDPSAKLGLDVASCLITRFPLAQDAEGKTKEVICLYTPISDPDSKGHFDLLIKVYPDGKMSQHFASH